MRVDINKEAESILAKLPYTSVFYRPEQWNRLPVISFYDIHTSGTFDTDNAEDIYKGLLVVDVWTDNPADGAKIADEVTDAFDAAGWWRELNRFVDKTDGVIHRTLRFGKEFLNRKDD